MQLPHAKTRRREKLQKQQEGRKTGVKDKDVFLSIVTCCLFFFPSSRDLRAFA
jgi:hypothetical protein